MNNTNNTNNVIKLKDADTSHRQKLMAKWDKAVSTGNFGPSAFTVLELEELVDYLNKAIDSTVMFSELRGMLPWLTMHRTSLNGYIRARKSK